MLCLVSSRPKWAGDKIILNRFFASLAVLLAVCAAWGCAGRKDAAGFRKALAINMGVESKTIRLGHKDLGRHFQGLKGTKYDFLSTKAPKNKRLSLTYKTFGVSSIDAFNRSAVLLIGKFQFIDSIVDKFYVDTRRMLKTDLRKVRLVEIDEKLRVKAFKKTKMASIYKRAKGDLKGVLGGFSGVFKGIKRLHSDSIRLLKNAPKELSKDRRKAVYADVIMGELGQRVKDLGRLVKRGRSLTRRVAKTRAVMKALSKAKK